MTIQRATISRLLASMLLLEASSIAAAQQVAVEGEHSPPAAAGEDNDSVEAISARKLFLEGRALLDQNQPREACDKLERSHVLSPTLATLLNLGLCHSYSGRLATAHDYYRQAEVLATLQNDAARREFAHNEAAALAPRRASLILQRSGNAGAELDVELDDVRQPREVWEQPVFVDAGAHRIRVGGRALQSWEGAVQVTDGNKHVVVIPELAPRADTASESAPQHAPVPATPAASTPEPELQATAAALTPEPSPARASADSSPGLQPARIAALAVAGAGVVALGVSLAFTLSASATYDESEELCRSDGTCSPHGLELRDDAHAAAARATAFAIGGAVALGTGVAWWLLGTPSHPEPADRVMLAPGPHSLEARWSGRL